MNNLTIITLAALAGLSLIACGIIGWKWQAALRALQGANESVSRLTAERIILVDEARRLAGLNEKRDQTPEEKIRELQAHSDRLAGEYRKLGD